MVHCHRGDYFDVIEFWVENQLLIELLPPEIVGQYLAFYGTAIAASHRRTIGHRLTLKQGCISLFLDAYT